MEDNVEVQAEEIEALEAIFPDEFEKLSDTAPYKYRIYIVPNPGGKDSENHVSIYLLCDIPAEYPAIAPILDVEVKKGLGTKHKEELLDIVRSTADDNLDMPSIYTIVEAAREWLVDNNIEGQDGSMYAEMMRRMQQKDVEKKKQKEKAAIISAADSEKTGVALDPEEEERIRRRQAGHPVTMEVFMEWKKKFEAEMREIRLREEGPDCLSKDDKPSGKQLFLSNRAGLEEALIAAAESETSVQLAAALSAGGGAGAVGEEGVAVSEDLFLDDVEDDEDLDDLLDDDDDDDDDEDYEDDA